MSGFVKNRRAEVEFLRVLEIPVFGKRQPTHMMRPVHLEGPPPHQAGVDSVHRGKRSWRGVVALKPLRGRKWRLTLWFGCWDTLEGKKWHLEAFPSPPLQSQLLILTLGGRDKSSQDVSDHVWSAAKTAVTGSSPPLFFSQKTCEHRARHGRKEKWESAEQTQNRGLTGAQTAWTGRNRYRSV